MVLGASVLSHPAPVSPVRLTKTASAVPLRPRAVPLPLPSMRPGGPHPGAVLPALAEVAQRANRDDVLLYHEQWQVIALMASATRDYLDRHVVPLLLAAARGRD